MTPASKRSKPRPRPRPGEPGWPGYECTAGIDYDTNGVHVVLLRENGHAEYHRFDLSGSDAFERVRSVRDAMPARGWWRDEGVVACAIEEPQGVQKATVAKLKAVQGAVLACLPADLLVEPMVPARWRAAVGLAGNASKVDVWEHVWDREGGDGAPARWMVTADGFVPYDATDAYCLALAVSTLWEKAA